MVSIGIAVINAVVFFIIRQKWIAKSKRVLLWTIAATIVLFLIYFLCSVWLEHDRCYDIASGIYLAIGLWLWGNLIEKQK